MTSLRKHFICPKHEEKTASAYLYADGWFCFGCGVGGPLSDLGVILQESEVEAAKVTPENVAKTYSDYIDKLPIGDFRGLRFPFDNYGFFITWPKKNYYKYRRFEADAKGKYRGPVGVKAEPICIRGTDPSTLIITEGELNAISIASLNLGPFVMSPGSAGNFSSRKATWWGDVNAFKRILLIFDKDKPGTEAAIESKSKLLTLGHNNHRVLLWERDANDKYQEGKEKLKEELEKELAKLQV